MKAFLKKYLCALLSRQSNLHLLFFYASIFVFTATNTTLPDKNYPFSNEPIDVVFVCHPKDKITLELAIDGIKKNGEDIRKVFVVSHERLTDKAEWFDEKKYPFDKLAIAMEIFDQNLIAATAYVNASGSRIGWIYQQFLKMYAPFIIPNISSNVLIIDADTIFLNPVKFISEDGKHLFNPGFEYEIPYFEHGACIIPGFKKIFTHYSGISHHMLFQTNVLEDLFNSIETYTKKVAWKAMASAIDVRHLYYSALADYELYFNFVFSRTNQVMLRFLRWANIPFDKDNIERHRMAGYHYVSCHAYLSK